MSASIAGWVAGQRHCVVARWDNDNGLSGANKLGLSIDGDLLLAAQADYATTGAFPELLQIYNLLGDPGLRIW